MATTQRQPLSLESHLSTLFPSGTRPSLRQKVLPKILQSISHVAKILQSESTVSQVGTANSFGDDQLNVDVLAENKIRDAIADCAEIVTASSEEDPVERSTRTSTADPDGGHEGEGNGKEKEEYTVAFDPLDGSSIIAPNWTVGTIIGIWDGPTALNQSPSKQIAAILGVYGPRTTAIVSLNLSSSTQPTCFEIGYEPSTGAMNIVNPAMRLDSPPFKTRYFAPANLRAAADDEKYMALVTRLIEEKYTLRYSGGLVPDVVHALVKGHGVYVSPVTEKSKAKLRRLYELLPVALVVECAGGSAVDSKTGERILEREVRDTDERAGLICGTGEDVEEAKGALLG